MGLVFDIIQCASKHDYLLGKNGMHFFISILPEINDIYRKRNMWYIFDFMFNTEKFQLSFTTDNCYWTSKALM